MIINLLRLILGFVEFEATGGFPERFLNLCTINGITLWNVQNNGVKVKACTPAKAYINIRKSARNSGMKVRITRKRGLPFFLKKNKARVGIVIGIFVTVLFLFASSCMLWDIEVTGNSKLKSENLLESLESKGVRIGVFKSGVDTRNIEDELLEEYPDLSWASINIFGTKAVLEVKENTKKPEIADDKTPANVVAKKDGQIILVQGHRGTNAVKEGDVVVKGDLLISGITTNSDGSEKTVHATGKVFAETITTINENTLKLQNNKMLKSSETKYYLYLLGFDIPMFLKCKGETLYCDKKLLKGKETTLPFGVSWEVFGNWEECEVELTDKQTELLALLGCVDKKRNSFDDDCEFESVSYETEITENNIKIRCRIKAKENIAIEKEFFVE